MSADLLKLARSWLLLSAHHGYKVLYSHIAMSEYKAFYNHDGSIIGGDSLSVAIERENISRTRFESR